jgi:hypothetical protein
LDFGRTPAAAGFASAFGRTLVVWPTVIVVEVPRNVGIVRLFAGFSRKRDLIRRLRRPMAIMPPAASPSTAADDAVEIRQRRVDSGKPCSDVCLGDPDVRVDRCGLLAKRLEAGWIAAAGRDPGKNLRVSSAQDGQLLGSQQTLGYRQLAGMVRRNCRCGLGRSVEDTDETPRGNALCLRRPDR